MIIKVGRRVLDHVILRLPIESHPCGLETNTIVTIYDVVYRAITTTTTSLFFSYEQLSFTRTFHTSDSEIVFIFEISQISGGLIFLSEIDTIDQIKFNHVISKSYFGSTWNYYTFMESHYSSDYKNFVYRCL